MAWEQAEALRSQAPVRTFLGRLTDAHTEERSWRVGAKGEEAVADQLARLRGRDPRWGYLNAVPVGTRGSDIDHVIMGPGGVFTINAKHHPGGKVWVAGTTLMVNGKKRPYIRNAVHEGDRASRLLSAACGFHVSVFPMIVLVGHASLTIRTPPEGVLLVNRRQLSKFLRRLPDAVPPSELGVILDQARISTTWSSR
ncbi:nuclease-like protein [Georgenia soli]|uniref:Nuclease-like protein n=1 Tax=Georgenia soli TaxID=638953 RepID=A0A2A9ERW5_9MICO|nr:nuclease-related domain-containing protein [Georgenia soli]PFG41010.1 nuclease-like protein [Georgenia soli]